MFGLPVSSPVSADQRSGDASVASVRIATQPAKQSSVSVIDLPKLRHVSPPVLQAASHSWWMLGSSCNRDAGGGPQDLLFAIAIGAFPSVGMNNRPCSPKSSAPDEGGRSVPKTSADGLRPPSYQCSPTDSPPFSGKWNRKVLQRGHDASELPSLLAPMLTCPVTSYACKTGSSKCGPISPSAPLPKSHHARQVNG